jgi:hypothetical protein
MKWSELDELLVEAARTVVEQNEIHIANLMQKLGIEYTHAWRLVRQLEALKIVTPYDENEIQQTLFSKVDAVQVYLNELRSLEEFTQADIDRYNYMRSVDHWKEYEDPLLALNFLDDELSGEEVFNRLMNGNDSSVVERFQPQLAFKRSTFQRILYSTWAVRVFWLSFAFLFIIRAIAIGNKSWQAEDFYNELVLLLAFLSIAFLGLEPFWKKHLRTPMELYWIGDHFEAVFPDGKLDPKPDFSSAEFPGGNLKGCDREYNDWLTLVPASGYFGANGRQLVKSHQAWMGAQKKE